MEEMLRSATLVWGELEDEAALARGFASREPWAYEAAYEMYSRTLYAAAFGVLRERQEAQDCVHDVLVRLWKTGNAYCAERGSLRAFLAVCVRNEALSRSRKSSNRDSLAAQSPVAREQPDVGDAVVERESIRRALETLNDKQRRSIEMAYYDRLTHEQIAAALGEPVSTIKSRLSGALRRLRAVFASEEPHATI